MLKDKVFVTQEEYRNNAIKLVDRIYRGDKFVPDVIYASLRGGVYMANIFSEYYKVVLKGARRPVFYAAVVARSYSDLERIGGKIVIDGWTYAPEYLRNGDKVLIVDDIFDTGKTVNGLVNAILEKGIPRCDVKVAVYDYKVSLYKEERLPVQPDYWCFKRVLKTPEEDKWIHYLFHEIEGLCEEEIDKYVDDEEVRNILKSVIK